jgi:anti-anti-sigma factor
VLDEVAGSSTRDGHAPEAPGALIVEPYRKAEAIVLALGGELDLATAELVRDALEHARAERPARLVIDLSGLSFIDSTGLALLVSEAKRCNNSGEPDLEVWPGSEQVQRLFEIAGVVDRLPFVGQSDREVVPQRQGTAPPLP